MKRLAKVLVQRYEKHPGAFYIFVLTAVVAIQIVSFLALKFDGRTVEVVLPTYTHILALTVGTVFLFRAVQLLGALSWTKLARGKPLPNSYARDMADLPVVTVQIPLRNEPLEVASAAIDAAFALNYPPECLEIQVIDNSSSPEFYEPINSYVEAMRQKAGHAAPSVRFLHREGTVGFKAGNLNLGLAEARGDFFMILDADSTVPQDTLLRALPYFEDPKLGFVQLRIDPRNEDENIITRAAAVTIRARYVAMGMRDSQGIVQFDGHNGLFRGTALKAVGGWSEDVSEDLVTSVRVILAGYRGRYAQLPSSELLPNTFPELFRQRQRWALGTAVFMKRESLSILRSKKLRWFEKLDLFYASVNIVIEAFILIALFTFAPLPALTFLAILIVFSIIPTLLTTQLGFWETIRRQFALIFVISAVFPALVQGVLQGLFGVRVTFSVTKKNGGQALDRQDLLRSISFAMLLAGVFFTGAIWLSPTLGAYLNSYLPGTIILGASVVTPIVLNYWRGELRP